MIKNKPKRIYVESWSDYLQLKGVGIFVGVPSLWWNPLHIGDRWFHLPTTHSLQCIKMGRTPQETVDLYRQQLECCLNNEHNKVKALEKLRGKDLYCTCPPDYPCHADILLDLANRPLDEYPWILRSNIPNYTYEWIMESFPK